jgi:hypothetical protein
MESKNSHLKDEYATEHKKAYKKEAQMKKGTELEQCRKHTGLTRKLQLN